MQFPGPIRLRALGACTWWRIVKLDVKVSHTEFGDPKTRSQDAVGTDGGGSLEERTGRTKKLISVVGLLRVKGGKERLTLCPAG